jgi:hypothetical protein
VCSVPVTRRNATSRTTQDQPGPHRANPAHTAADDVTDRHVMIAGEPFVRSNAGIELLSEGTHLGPLSAYQELKRAARAGTIEAVRIHSRLSLYREADVLELRARILARG